MPITTIKQYRKNNGICLREVFEPYIDEFVEKFENRKSYNALAEEYGVDRHTITSYAKKLGIYNKKENLINDKQIQEIIDSYYCCSGAELAQKYGISISRIEQVWSKAGLSGKVAREYNYNEHYFSNINSYDKAYFLGFIGSDGCIFNPNDTRQSIIKITIQNQDKRILETFKEKLDSTKPVYSGDKYSTFELSSDIMAKDLTKIGLSYKKTYKNCIAEVDREYMPDLIRGYFDGDGTITNIKNIENSISKVEVSIAGFEKNMIKIQSYLESRNIFSVFVEDKRKYNHTTNDRFGSLCMPNKTSVYCFLKLIYEDKNDCYLERKYQNAKKLFDYIENSPNIRDKQIVCYYKYAVCGVS